MPKAATVDRVDRDALLEFLRAPHHAVLLTRRRGGGPQLSPVTCAVDVEVRVVISTYPPRAKVTNARRDPAVSLCVLSEDWNGAWRKDPRAPRHSQARCGPLHDGRHYPSGEHPAWDEYRTAMARQGKSLLRVTVPDWGPVATGGFPPEIIDKL